MRTTIRLPDHLYTEVRVVAAASGSTVTSFIENALRAELARRASLADATPFRLKVWGGKGMGVQAGVELTNNAALLDLMEFGE
ncbi:MAG TPA: CopG family transcriptional regulator [Candidatus Nanopelagicales bacterium]|jgi:hypothetical protein